jgi:hypothetical protein
VLGLVRAEDPPAVLLLNGRLCGVPCHVMIDTGASRSCASAAWLQQHGFFLQPCALVVARTVNSQQLTISRRFCASRALSFGNLRTTVQLLPMPTRFGGAQVLLGMDWLAACNAVIAVATRTVSITCAGRTTALRAAASLPSVSQAPSQVEYCTFTVAFLQQLCANSQFLSAKQAD